MSVAAESERQVSPDVAKCIAEERIPIIDVSGYLSGDPDAVEQFATDLRAIQESLGFYCIINHGIDQGLIDRSFEQIAELFKLSDETKMKYRVDFHHQGFIPNKSLILRWSKIAKNEKKDLNEAWAFMRERDGRRSQGEGQHPSPEPQPVARGTPRIPQATLLEYQETMAVLATRMLPAYARALEMPADYFDDKFSHPEYYNRCAWYPPVDAEEGQFSLSPHSDHSSMTYLAPDGRGGTCRSWRPSGKWMEIEPLRGAIVVNTGEFFNRWTNGRFIATPHRVVPPLDHRYALTFFYNCNDETVADPIPTCINPGEEPVYEPMSFHDFFITYMDGNYIYRTAEMDED